jgi:hypothetical protein
MRVTHVITRLIIGGAQENTVASVLGLQHRPGMEIALLAGPTTGPEGSLESAFQSCPQVLSIVPSLVRPVHPLNDFLAWLRLTKIFRATRPDIVHTHSGKAGILGRWAAHRAGVHPQRAAHAPGYALQKFQPGQVRLAGAGRDLFQFCARSAAQLPSQNFYPAKTRMGQANHHAANPAVPNQQIGAAPQNHHGRAPLPANPHDARQITFRRRLHVNVGATASAQGGPFGQGFPGPHDGPGQGGPQFVAK